MATEATFDQLLEWLQSRSGKRVYLEVGTTATDTEMEAEAFPVALWVTIEGIESATNIDLPDRMGVMVRLGEERNRLHLEPERITRIERHIDAWKVWYLDRFYVGLSG